MFIYPVVSNGKLNGVISFESLKSVLAIDYKSNAIIP